MAYLTALSLCLQRIELNGCMDRKSFMMAIIFFITLVKVVTHNTSRRPIIHSITVLTKNSSFIILLLLGEISSQDYKHQEGSSLIDRLL